LTHFEDIRERQIYKFLLLRSACVLKNHGDDLAAQSLCEIALDPSLNRSNDWVATPDAIEVIAPTEFSFTEQLSFNKEPINAEIIRAFTISSNTGPNLEPKYRFTQIRTFGNKLEITLAPSSWQEGKSFHKAVQDHPEHFLRSQNNWVVPMPLGEVILPGIAVIHGIVLTSDNRLLLVQRSSKLSYAPLHWSASFEEQITASDMKNNTPLTDAARRGMMEEFGIKVSRDKVQPISMILEIGFLNLASVVLIHTNETAKEIQQKWSNKESVEGAWEANALDSIEVSRKNLDSLATAKTRPRQLHPTSQIRCALLARWLQLP